MKKQKSTLALEGLEVREVMSVLPPASAFSFAAPFGSFAQPATVSSVPVNTFGHPVTNTTPVNTFGHAVTNTVPVNTFGQHVTNTTPVNTFGNLVTNTTPVNTFGQHVTNTTPVDTFGHQVTNTTPVDIFGQAVTNTVPVNTYGKYVTNTTPVDIYGHLVSNTTPVNEFGQLVGHSTITPNRLYIPTNPFFTSFEVNTLLTPLEQRILANDGVGHVTTLGQLYQLGKPDYSPPGDTTSPPPTPPAKSPLDTFVDSVSNGLDHAFTAITNTATSVGNAVSKAANNAVNTVTQTVQNVMGSTAGQVVNTTVQTNIGLNSPAGTSEGAGVAQTGVQISASNIPGAMIDNYLLQAMTSPDPAIAQAAANLYQSKQNEVGQGGNVAQGLQWQANHSAQLQQLVQQVNAYNQAHPGHL